MVSITQPPAVCLSYQFHPGLTLLANLIFTLTNRRIYTSNIALFSPRTAIFARDTLNLKKTEHISSSHQDKIGVQGERKKLTFTVNKYFASIILRQRSLRVVFFHERYTIAPRLYLEKAEMKRLNSLL